jgi:hypothetical protein
MLVCLEVTVVRTNVVLEERKVAVLMRLMRTKTKTAAVARAVDEQIRREKLARLAALLGRVEIDEEKIGAMEQAEVERTRRVFENGGRHGRRRANPG